MEKVLMNNGWEYAEAALQNPLLVNLIRDWKTTDLPHDYAPEKGRVASSPAGLDEGFFQGAGLYYRKAFRLTEKDENQCFWLEFEGIAGVAEIWLNKQLIGKYMNPYTSLLVNVTDQIQPGENEIMVHLDSRMKPGSRWYVGTGLYRSVWMYIAESKAVHPYGPQCRTESLSASAAMLSLQYGLQAPDAEVVYSLMDKSGRIVSCAEGAVSEMTVPNPRSWSPDDPYLYTLQTKVTCHGKTDQTEQKIGIRTIEVSSAKGLLLNGEPMKLKGGCIHHDLGILGAADFPAAECRRIRKLKESGFNAVRLAHNPFGPAIFDACDELGMLAVEEAFDEWVLGRTSFGLHITFEDRWEKDLEDMILRDYNHPSILMWGTGNEVEERDGSADGFIWARRLAEKVKTLDPSRPVTASACALFSEYGQKPADGTTGNQALNMAFDNFASGRDLWGDTTAPYFAPLDVAGYNYKNVRYAHDAKKFPSRVIYGSESYPRAAFQSWNDTMNQPNVIGDFVWTAWDYLGEVGVGRWEVSDSERPGNPEWPWMLASCSDIDLIGEKRPQSYYRNTIWDVDDVPHLFCLPPALTGRKIARLSWGWLPVERNYSYRGCEGKMMEAHIYARADEVELIRNGVSLGRKSCGEAEEYIAVFTFPYEPGTLEAIAWKNGEERGRDLLKTAEETACLQVTADRNTLAANGQDLLFVSIRAVDSHGCPVWNSDQKVEIDVRGGTLQAFGTADPCPDTAYPFTQSTCRLYHGQALAVIRSRSTGQNLHIRVRGEGMEPLTMEVPLLQDSRKSRLICDIQKSAIDETLGNLLERKVVKEVLAAEIPDILNNPMLDAMRGMSLRKLLTIGGKGIPEKLCAKLDAVWEDDQEC